MEARARFAHFQFPAGADPLNEPALREGPGGCRPPHERATDPRGGEVAERGPAGPEQHARGAGQDPLRPVERLAPERAR
eukprot:11768116-Alexandrium_andersonii.AAC.1